MADTGPSTCDNMLRRTHRPTGGAGGSGSRFCSPPALRSRGNPQVGGASRAAGRGRGGAGRAGARGGASFPASPGHRGRVRRGSCAGAELAQNAPTPAPVPVTTPTAHQDWARWALRVGGGSLLAARGLQPRLWSGGGGNSGLGHF
jgi:hypothetical protein